MSLRRTSWLGLLLALLLMQQLGLGHRYAHNGLVTAGKVVGNAAVSSAVNAVDISTELRVDSGFGSLPAHDKPLCVLLDQLCTAGTLQSQPFVLPALPLAGVSIQRLSRTFTVRWAAPFQARGPPVIS